MRSFHAPHWVRAAATVAALVPLSIAATVGAAFASDEPSIEPAPVVESSADLTVDAPDTEPVSEPVAELAAETVVEAAETAALLVPEPAASTNDPQDPEEPAFPTAKATYPASPAAAYAGWYDAAVPVTITGTATAPADVAEIVWALSGAMTGSGSHSGSTTTITIDAEGKTTLEYFVVDTEGLASEAHTIEIGVDTVAPVIDLIAPSTTDEYVAGEQLTVDYTCTDRFLWICYLEDLATGTRYADGDAIELAEGAHDYRLVIRDLAGREVVIDRSISVAPAPDAAAPVLTISPREPLPASGWYTTAVTVSITAADESPIESLEFRSSLPGGEWSSWDTLQPPNGGTELTGLIQFFASGQFSYQFRATDSEGNTSEPHSYVHRVDKEILPARIEGFRSELALGELYAPEFACADTVSGTSTCSSSNGASGTPVPTDSLGDHTFTTTHTDVAGNSVTTTWTYTVVADSTLPEVTASSTATGWTSADGVEVTFRASDDVAVERLWVVAGGADGAPLHSVAGGSYVFTATTEGVTTVTVYAVDAAGNRSADVTVTVRIDRTPPTITITSPANRIDSLVATSDVTVGQVVDLEFECDDLASGVVSCAATGGATRLPTAQVGEHSIEIAAVDAAGNRAIRTLNYTVVAAPPSDPGAAPKPGLLASTGLEIWLGLLLVAALFAAGVTALTVSRPRR